MRSAVFQLAFGMFAQGVESAIDFTNKFWDSKLANGIVDQVPDAAHPMDITMLAERIINKLVERAFVTSHVGRHANLHTVTQGKPGHLAMTPQVPLKPLFAHHSWRAQRQTLTVPRKRSEEKNRRFHSMIIRAIEIGSEDGIPPEIEKEWEFRPDRNDEEWLFFDTATINVKGGDGGNGCCAMRREAHVPRGGPAGGSGGDGGNVYLVCNKNLNTLAKMRNKVHHKAKKGLNGLGKNMHGKSGADWFVEVPPGTVVKDMEGQLVGELVDPGDTLRVARGGKGGRGNTAFKSHRNPTPEISEKGEPGVERWINVELRLMSDVGFVGVPSAGKSTLLRASSNAKPKIGNYPFTTVVPNLGVCDLFDYSIDDGPGQGGGGLVLVDIPGLLEGAHDGIGMGIAFLRHVARCRVLIHVISGLSSDPVGDFRAINEELRLFNPMLAEKPQIVALNKLDIPEVMNKAPILLAQLRAAAGHDNIMAISAVKGENVKELLRRTAKLVEEQPEAPTYEESEPDISRVKLDMEGDEYDAKLGIVGKRGFRFDIEEQIPDWGGPRRFIVRNSKLERMVRMTNWEQEEATRRFQRVLEVTGINKEMEARGAEEGDEVVINDFEFEWIPYERDRWLTKALAFEDSTEAAKGRQMVDALNSPSMMEEVDFDALDDEEAFDDLGMSPETAGDVKLFGGAMEELQPMTANVAGSTDDIGILDSFDQEFAAARKASMPKKSWRR